LPLHLDHRLAPAQFRPPGWSALEPRGQQQRGDSGISKLALALVACCLLSQSTAASPIKAVRRILSISSLGPTSPFTARINEAISTVHSQLAETFDPAPQLQPAAKRFVVVDAVGLVFLVETLLVFALVWQRKKRRKVEQSLFERLTFETLVSDLSITLSLPEAQVGAHRETEKSLRKILEFFKMNQIAVLATDRAEPELIVSVDSPGEGVEPNYFPWIPREGPVLVSDLSDLPEASAEREYLKNIGAVSAAMIPLNAGDGCLGCISFLSTARRVLWTEELVKRLEILAEIFSNASTRKRVQETLARLSGKLIDAQERERSRIARDLHDDICQRLTLLSIEIEHSIGDSGSIQARAERMQEVWEHCSEIASAVQALSHELHPSMLDLLGLTAAMKNFCHEFSQRQDVVVGFSHTDVPDSLPRDVSLSLFRVAQEALHNAAKHSTANCFEVHLQGMPAGIQLEVHDAGAGFDLESVQKNGGLGLNSMRERIHIVKGSFTIDSKANFGTTIRAKVPLFADMGTKPAASKNVKAEAGETSWRRRHTDCQTTAS
jgi:signal transduction histidine kinase